MILPKNAIGRNCFATHQLKGGIRWLLFLSRRMMVTLTSASAVLLVKATNPEYNQPALRIDQAGNSGGAASIKINDPNPDIEFVETDQVAPAGKYEIAVQSDKLQINGRNANDTAFETLVVFQRLAAGGNIGLRTNQPVWRRTGCHRDCQCFCRSVGESRWRWDFVCRGWGTYVSGLEWNGDSDRARLARSRLQGGNGR